MAPALNIAALARRTGVQPDTLRKWEHRYGVICPDRTPGGQRRYSERDVARVEWLKARLAEGYRIGEAAQLLGATEFGEAPQSREELIEALYDAVAASDSPRVELLVEQTLAVNDVKTALADVIAPVLRRVGDGWASGELTVAQEHMLSGVVRAHLGRLLADTRGSIRGIAVLACAPGERHELGLLMFAIMLRADGWQVDYLGADTPVADAATLADAVGARLLCISATMDESFEAFAQAASAAPPNGKVRFVLGGNAASAEAAQKLGCLYLEPDLSAAVAAIRS